MVGLGLSAAEGVEENESISAADTSLPASSTVSINEDLPGSNLQHFASGVRENNVQPGSFSQNIPRNPERYDPRIDIMVQEQRTTRLPESRLLDSIECHDEFMQKRLPDLGHDVADTKVFTWTLCDWRSLGTKLLSPEFNCGGHSWRVLLFPKGNKQIEQNEWVSIYLDYASDTWDACAQLALVLSHPNDPTNFLVHHSHHRFTPENCDWGFTRFSPIKELFLPTKTHGRPIIENESIMVTVFLRVFKDPTGLLWRYSSLKLGQTQADQQRLLLTVKWVTEQSFSRHHGFDLASFNAKDSDVPEYSVLRDELYSSFKSRVARSVGLPTDRFRLWVMVNRLNKTVRPNQPIPDDNPELTMAMIQTTMGNSREALRLFVDVRPEDVKNHPKQSSGSLMVFLKHFNPQKQTIYGVSKVFVHKDMKIGDLDDVLNDKMNWPKNIELQYFEEIKLGLIERINPEKTFLQSEIQDGDVICFHMKLNADEAAELKAQGLCSSPVQLYELIQNSVKVRFKLRSEADTDTGFELTLCTNLNYNLMSERVGDHLKCDPQRLRFTTTHINGLPKQVLKHSTKLSISKMVDYSDKCILYELLDNPLQESETEMSLGITWMGSNNKCDSVYNLLLSRKTTFAGLAAALAEQINSSNEDLPLIRIFSISKDGRRQEGFKEIEAVGTICNGVRLYAEEKSFEELEIGHTEILTSVCHWNLRASRASGIPFCFVVKPKEDQLTTKRRISTKLRFVDTDWTKFKFVVFQRDTIVYVNDEQCLYDQFSSARDTLGLISDIVTDPSNGIVKSPTISVELVTKESFCQHQGFDLATFRDKDWSGNLVEHHVSEKELYSEFKNRITEAMDLPTHRVCLWVMQRRTNNTIRPIKQIQDHDITLTMGEILNTVRPRSDSLKLFVDVLPEGLSKYPKPTNTMLMIFLKVFDAQKQELYGVANVFVHHGMKVEDLDNIVLEKMNWRIDTRVTYYEEAKPGSINIMAPKATFFSKKIQNGDIICFQAEISQEEIFNLNSRGLHSSAMLFYHSLQDRVMIHFKLKDKTETDAGFVLRLGKSLTYDQMSEEVGDYLRHNAQKLRFTTTNAAGLPKKIVHPSPDLTVSKILESTSRLETDRLPFVLYELLSVPIYELKNLEIIWIGQHNKEEDRFQFLLEETTEILTLRDYIFRQISHTNGSGDSGSINIFSISSGGMRQRRYADSMQIGSISGGTELYAESREETQINSTERPVYVCHWDQKLSKAFGIPFRLMLRAEKFSITKGRILKRLQLSEADQARLKFGLIRENVVTYIDDEECLYDRTFLLEEDFGIIYSAPELDAAPGPAKKRKSLRVDLFPRKLIPSFGKSLK